MPPPAARLCCLDLDTFFVSVERLLDPALVGRPVIVGGRRGQRGVVTACSYEVRACGVRSGMSMVEAERLAPREAVFLPTRGGTYEPYSRQVRALLEGACPVVQAASIDEFYLDYGGCDAILARPGEPGGDAALLREVRALRQRIQDELGLPASVGIGATRAIAKMASRDAKPAGVFLVPLGQERAYVAALPVRAFPGIGPVSESNLQQAGVHTLGQLLDLPPGPLRHRVRGLLESVSHGIDPARAGALGHHRPAFREHDPQGVTVGSISNERTFLADVREPGLVLDQLRALSERVAWRARGRDVRARTVALKLRYADFDTITRARTIPPTCDESEIHRCILGLYAEHRDPRRAVRLVGVALSNLVAPDRQLRLPFADAERPDPGKAIDEVRRRFGYDAIRVGAPGSGQADPSRVRNRGSPPPGRSATPRPPQC
ncbi:MAG: DNA polymerase IV [Pseudomonadota bacterium]